MAYPLSQQGEHFTYRDLLDWPEGERWELIDGVAYDMSPSPTESHQIISMELSRQFANFLIGKYCRVYSAPFDVLLPKGDEADEDVDTVVQPDIMVVCDPKKRTERGCIGAPDLIIEVISPSTAQKDLREKYRAYERAGVREYWVVYPLDRTVMVYKLGENGRYAQPRMYRAKEGIEVESLEGLTIDLAQVFTEI